MKYAWLSEGKMGRIASCQGTKLGKVCVVDVKSAHEERCNFYNAPLAVEMSLLGE